MRDMMRWNEWQFLVGRGTVAGVTHTPKTEPTLYVLLMVY